jgi:hypothetical protein
MFSFAKKNYAELLICILIAGIGTLFFTLVADDYGGFTYYSLPGGQFSDYPYMDNHYLGLIGISYILELFYLQFPAYNWQGLFFLFFDFLALFILLVSIKKVVLPKHTNRYLLVFIQLTIGLFYLENVVSISHTRFSLVLCGIGLFNLAFIPNIDKKGIFVFSVIFLLGMLIRPESSIGMLMLMTGAHFLINFNIKLIAKRLLLPSFFTLLLFGGFAIDWHHTDVFVKKVEPEIEYKMMARKMVDLSTMKTAEDSIKYQAAIQGMWFDFRTLSPEYLRSIQLQGFSLNRNSAADQSRAPQYFLNLKMNAEIQHLIAVVLHVLSFYIDYALIPFLILSLLGLSIAKPKTSLRILLFATYTFALIYAIDYSSFMIGKRHFIAIQIVSMVVLLYYFFREIPWERLPIIKQIAFYSMLSIGIAITLIHYKKANNESAYEMNYHEETMNKIDLIYNNRLIVVTIDNFSIFNRKFSITQKQYTNNKYIMFDMFTYSLTPNYLSYLSRQCNCDPADPIAIYQWLSNEQAIYIAKPTRFDLTEKYMRLIHHQNLHFTKPRHYEELIEGEDPTKQDYELRQVSIN